MGKSHKDFIIASFQIRVWVKLIQNRFLNSIGPTWPLEWSLLLERANYLSGINRLSGINCLSGPCYFWKIILKHFISKNDNEPFIHQISLICHKLNLFRCKCDFLVGQTTTLDLQWRASHYLKRLLRLK